MGNQYSTSVIENVEAILSVGAKHKCQILGIDEMKISMVDSSESDIGPYLYDATAFIHEAVSSKKTILVHCKAGINRSPIVVIAYLAMNGGMKLNEAIQHVKNARKIVRIQPHYIHQVEIWLTNP